ncbi:MAG: CBS domain-containing protein, partial [Thermodesulfobacteriota bacterium]
MSHNKKRKDSQSNQLAAPTVITGHTNADFDCLAAIVAAGKLYPEGVLIFPGSQEKNLRDFFIQSATYLYNFRNFKEIDQSTVQRLILVDTRQKSRLKHVQPLWERSDIAIHTYDHHPDTGEDVQATRTTVREWGATTSILVAQLRENNIAISPDEATLLGLGLYEDTGCFTFSSTTSHDLSAAAWLREQGMDPNFIAEMVQRELSAEQVALLNELLDAAVTHDINGIEVVVSQVTTEEFVSDFALLVHKMMDMQNLRVFFALGRMQDRIHVVARSRTPEVNVGQICSSFGGGGHPYAASATVKDRTLAQVKDELFGLLYSHINPQIQIRDLMSAPPITVEQDASLQHASEVMTRYGLKAIPALRSGTQECVGILEHQLADRAVAHGLGQMSVSEYMGREFATVQPDSSLYPTMEIILGQRQRLVPVIQDASLIGVITRTDLINTLIAEPARIPESMLPERRRERNISTLLQNNLPQEVVNMLTQAGNLARDMGYHVYAVGGFVRDILLHRRNLDVDLVVEGDGIRFARRLALEMGGRVRAHKKFKTAVLILPDEQRIDVATARLEYYEHPAALPTVELSTVKMDLSRRDFTVNALAVQLDPEQFGKLVDFFGGQKDIKEKTIRVMHSLSFVEDPTRILRAVRFEQR